ncbi:alcohol oxidase [Exidia glandulosa HHB12029]|uniref:Alcohol oxidase n=1 Tax=Exidia glandulosa HHB12029 TaxID=1314781 RepID=A0A165D5B7_EXIGL|nr:alcohol oxidase [Exidia glandulosa HHB12029]
MRPSSFFLRSLVFVLASVGAANAIEVDATTFAKQNFDFIVCGGGTAGTALAVRLSEISSFKVGVIEGGKYHKDDLKILTPQGINFADVWNNPEYDWMFKTTPQRNLAGRSIDIVRGKGLGGSSMVNLMGFLRAGKVEYDQIGQLGNPGARKLFTGARNHWLNPGWSWNEITPYFMKAENASLPTKNETEEIHAGYDPAIRGHKGPIQTSVTSWFSEAIPPFFDVLVGMGMQADRDFNDGTDANFVWPPILAIDPDTETRSYAANSYYEPNAKRKNLVVLLQSQVLKVELSAKKDKNGNLRATGVTYQDMITNKTYTASVKKDVIVSGGGIQSPQMLELSGIGNKTLLESFGIKSRIDLPDIGENYQDHLISFQSFEVPNTMETWDILYDPEKNASAYEEYMQNHTGVYTAGVSVISYMSLNKVVDAATLKNWTAELDREFFARNPSPGRRLQYAIQRKRLDPHSNEASIEYYAAPSNAYADTREPNKSYMQIACIPSHQFSRGSIHVKSGNPLDHPGIDLNTFDFTIDKRIMLAGTRLGHNLTDKMPLKQIVVNDVKPPAHTDTDDEWNEFIAQTASTPFHPCCTNSMLPRELGGVVNPRLVVYGTSNLRVADVSILPMILGTHLMATAYAIGERAADFIKEDYGVLH